MSQGLCLEFGHVKTENLAFSYELLTNTSRQSEDLVGFLNQPTIFNQNFHHGEVISSQSH